MSEHFKTHFNLGKIFLEGILRKYSKLLFCKVLQFILGIKVLLRLCHEVTLFKLKRCFLILVNPPGMNCWKDEKEFVSMSYCAASFVINRLLASHRRNIVLAEKAMRMFRFASLSIVFVSIRKKV